MTKKDFKRIARAVVAMQRSCEGDEAPLTDSQIEIIIDQLALCGSESNPRFDYSGFNLACRRK